MTMPGATASSSSTLPRILVVEDEVMLLQSVVAGLGRVPGVEVVGAGTVAAALQEIQARAPALIISDIDLPDRSGLELLGELGARGLKPHVVFVSAYVKAYRAQIPPNAGVEVLEKPVSLEQLRTLVSQRLSHPSSDGSPFGVSDYLQLASMGHHSVLIEVAGPTNTGNVVVVQGQAWSAQDKLGSGMDAFRRLVLSKGMMMVRCQTFQDEPGPRTLEGTAEALLLEAARLSDEGGDAEGMDAFTELSLDDAIAPQPSPAAPAPAPSAEPGFEDWFERGIEASLKKQHAVALEAFREAAKLNPTDMKTQANIQRLEQLLKQQGM